MGEVVAVVPNRAEVKYKHKRWDWSVFSSGVTNPAFRQELKKAQEREQRLCDTCVDGVCRISKRPGMRGRVLVIFADNPTDAVAILARLEGVLGEDFRTHREQISELVHKTTKAIIDNRLAFLEFYNREMRTAIDRNNAVVQMILSFSQELGRAYAKVSDELLAKIEEDRGKERDSLV